MAVKYMKIDPIFAKAKGSKPFYITNLERKVDIL